MTTSESLEALMLRLIQHRHGLPKDPEIARLAAQYFTGNARLSAVEQIEIYREQFWLRHTAALLEDFRGVSGILGQSAWERLCEEYFAAHPPRGFSLRDVGVHLPEFIETQATWLEHPRLVLDMARLEWAFVEVFDAAPASPLAPERLAAVDWDQAHIVLSPALRLFRVAYPVPALRRQLLQAQQRHHDLTLDLDPNTEQSGEPRGPTEPPIPIPDPEPARLLVHRPELSIVVEHLDEAEFSLLEALAAGETLPSALERAYAESGLVEEALSHKLGSTIKAWVERAIIVDVKP